MDDFCKSINSIMRPIFFQQNAQIQTVPKRALIKEEEQTSTIIIYGLIVHQKKKIGLIGKREKDN